MADGIAGPQTRSALGLGAGSGAEAQAQLPPAAAPARTRHRSHRGGGVRALQRALGVPADGVFGPADRARPEALAGGAMASWPTASPARRRAEQLGLGPGPVLKRGGGGKGGGGSGRVSRLIAAANRIATRAVQVRRRARLVTATRATTAPGSVSYALHFGGLLRDAARLERAS